MQIAASQQRKFLFNLLLPLADRPMKANNFNKQRKVIKFTYHPKENYHFKQLCDNDQKIQYQLQCLTFYKFFIF